MPLMPLIDGLDALKMREEGLQQLRELHTVLPEAGVAVPESKELKKVWLPIVRDKMPLSACGGKLVRVELRNYRFRLH